MPVNEYFRTEDGKSRIMRPDALVLMNGPGFDGSGEVVEREVPECDVEAFRRAGYKLGGLDKPKADEAPVEKPAEKKGRKKPE